MSEEYGPPIPVNGKRPEWLKDDDHIAFENLPGHWLHGSSAFYGWVERTDTTKPCPVSIRLRATHPYYQSAEYKASVRSDAMNELVALGQEQQIAEAIALLEATGHTVTPPDPLAAEREFLAGLLSRLGFGASADDVRDKGYDREIPAAMEYLTRWADARGNV